MNRVLFFTAFCTACTMQTLVAQQPELPPPQKEHQWLQQFVGEWKTEAEAATGPDQPPMQCSGEMTGRMIGEWWLVNEVTGDLSGTRVTALQTIGYDPAKKKYVGTWVDSMINHMWQYEGQVDETGKTLILEAEGPNFMSDGKLTNFRDAYEFVSPDHIVATSSIQNEKGEWTVMMTGHMRRAQ